MNLCDVLLVGYAVNSTSGGYTNENVKYVDTVRIKYLYSHFYGTYCAEPVAFLQLASEMRSYGQKVEILDGLLMGYTLDDMKRKLLEYDTNIYCFSLYESSKNDVLYLMNYVKKHNSNAIVVTGGPYVTLCYKELLERESVIDYIVIGDGDKCMPTLVDTLLKGKQPQDIPNLVRRSNGKAVVDVTPEAVNMDDLHQLARDFVDVIKEKGFSLSVASSRGCGYATCSFCYLKQYQKNGAQPKYRYRSPTLVVEEMKELINNYHIDKLTFVDDDFFGPNKVGIDRAEQIFKLIIEKNINLKLYMNVRVASVQELIRRDLLPLAARAGVRYMFIGFESYNDDILRKYKKGITTKDIDSIIEQLEENEIFVNPGMITFDHYSTPEQVKNNVLLLDKIHYYDLFMFTRTLMNLPDEKVGISDNKIKTGDFVCKKTEQLYNLMVRVRDLLYPLYGRIDQEKITESIRYELVRNHFSCFYSVYDDIMKNRAARVDDIIVSAVTNATRIVDEINK